MLPPAAAANTKEVHYNLPYQDMAAPVMGERCLALSIVTIGADSGDSACAGAVGRTCCRAWVPSQNERSDRKAGGSTALHSLATKQQRSQQQLVPSWVREPNSMRQMGNSSSCRDP